MSGVTVSMKLTPKQAGALYVKTMRLGDQVKALIVERDQANVKLAGVVDELQDFAAALDGMMTAGADADQIVEDLFKRMSHHGVGGAE